MIHAVRIGLHLDPDHLDGQPRLVVPEEDEAGVGHCGVRWCWLDVHQAAVLHDEPGGVAGDPLVPVHRRRAGIGVTSSSLPATQRYPGVQTGNERCSEHVGMDVAEPCPPTDRAHPTLGGPAAEALSV